MPYSLDTYLPLASGLPHSRELCQSVTLSVVMFLHGLVRYNLVASTPETKELSDIQIFQEKRARGTARESVQRQRQTVETRV